jgi:hypothetical protein
MPLRAPDRGVRGPGGDAAAGLPERGAAGDQPGAAACGGERVYRVPSLELPANGADATAVRDSEAVRLLADRAAAQGAPPT